MHILVTSSPRGAVISALVAKALEVLNEDVELVEEKPMPLGITIYPREYPAECKYVREKDWVQPRSKNQYKQKRRR